MMRVCLFLALLCVTLVSGQTVTRQGYFNGTTAPGGCLTPNPADTATYPLGVCVNTTQANDTTLSSGIFNDCAANGVITLSRFNGTDSCNPSFAMDLVELVGTYNGSPYCNAELGGGFATWNCSTVYPVNSLTTVHVTAYPFLAPYYTANSPNNNCNTSLTPAGTAPFEFPVGTCKTILSFGILASCVNGMVTAVFYLNPTCSLVYNATTVGFNNLMVPIGPYAQTGAAYAVGKEPATVGSTCGLVPGFSFMNFTCVTANPTTLAPTTATPTTATPTTATPTTPAPNNGTSSSSSSSTGVGAASTVVLSIAALVAPMIAAVAVLA